MLSEHKKFVRVIQSNRWDDGLNQEMSDQGSQPDEESVAFCTWQLLVLPQSSVRNKKNKHSFYPQLFFLGHLVLLQHPGSYRTWRLMHRRKEGKNISLSSSSGSTNSTRSAHIPRVSLSKISCTCSGTWWRPQQGHRGGPYLSCSAAVRQKLGRTGPASLI